MFHYRKGKQKVVPADRSLTKEQANIPQKSSRKPGSKDSATQVEYGLTHVEYGFGSYQ